MKIAIYQVNHERDSNNVCFVRYDSLANFQGDKNIDSKIYDKVFEGNVACKDLEDVYQMFNINHPKNYKGRSLSVSDVVEIMESDEVKKGSYFCDSFGFQEVVFDSRKSINKLETELKEMNVEQIREEYPVGTKIELINMDGESHMYPGLKGEVKSVDDIGQIHMRWENGSSLALNVGVDSFEKIEEKNKISVLLVEPFKEPKMIEIEDDLDAMQEIVGGYIEEYMPFEDDVAIVCNEEGKMRGLPLNRAIYLDSDPGKRNISDIIAGKFFVCYAPPESENFLSLPDDLAKKYDEKFKSPERFFKRDNEIVAIPFKPKSKEMER